MAKHMTIDTRKGIAHGFECRLTFAQMATMFSRAVSTIANEVKNRMRWSDKGYGCTNAVCERFETCSRVYRNADGSKTPYDAFVSFHGERGREFLEKLGVRRVNAESFVLDPILLGEKFKKEANRAILHRHGVL